MSTSASAVQPRSIETPSFVQTDPLTVARIPLLIPRSAIQTVMGPAIQEVYRTLQYQGIAPAGTWFAHHHRKPTDTFEFDVCVPVATPVAAAGRVLPGSIPSRPAVRTMYAGPYEGLHQAWTEFQHWVEESGRARDVDGLEIYTVNPGSTSDPSAWRTELLWFLVQDNALGS